LSSTVAGNLLPDIGKIAVLRANAIGDYIFAIPALEALRAAYPRAEIVLLGQPWHAGFLRGRPGPVDRVVVIPRTKGVREDRDTPGVEDDAEESERFFAAMQREKFDLALQIHGGGRYSNPFLRRLGARTTVGLRTPDAAPLDRWLPYIYWQPEILRLIEMMSLVGARAVTLEPRLVVTRRDLDEAQPHIPETEKPLAVIHPIVSSGRRQWPPEKFAAVADALGEAGCQVVVTGGAFEFTASRAMLAATRSQPVDLVGKLSLEGLFGLISRAALVVANDSGPLHLAEAAGVPRVGIYWCGNLFTADPLTRLRHRPVISWQLECSECGRNCIYDNCEHDSSFVAQAPVEDVLQAALDLLQANAAAPGGAQSASGRSGEFERGVQ